MENEERNEQQEQPKDEAQEKKPQEGKEPKERLYTEAELNAKIDEIVKQKKADLQRKFKEEQDEAAKLAGMNAEEKARHEAEKLRSELTELKNKQALHDMAKEARGMLQADGISLPDALLYKIIDVSAEKTKEGVADFSKLYREAVEAEVTKRLKGTPPPAEPQAQGGKSRGADWAERANKRFK